MEKRKNFLRVDRRKRVSLFVVGGNGKAAVGRRSPKKEGRLGPSAMLGIKSRPLQRQNRERRLKPTLLQAEAYATTERRQECLRYEDLMVLEAASQVTATLPRKQDSFTMWQARAALWPKTASSVSGLRDLTDEK